MLWLSTVLPSRTCGGCGHAFFSWTWPTRAHYMQNSAPYWCKYSWGQNRSLPLTVSNLWLEHSQIFQQKRLRPRDVCQKDLKDLDATDMDLLAGTNLYINSSLCPHYRGLLHETKKLWSKKKVFSYVTVNSTVRIRLQVKGPYSIITHTDDLKELFQEEDFSMLWLDCITLSVCTL